MKRLLVMRHAKSSWKSDAPTDHARPLNGRGRKAAPLMGEMLAELGWCPDTVLCSDAQRARETWERCAPRLPSPARVRFTGDLYFSGFEVLIATLEATPEDCGTLLTIGHNPTWERLVAWLCGQDVVMKTAYVALLEAPIEHWSDGFRTPERWTLLQILGPR